MRRTTLLIATGASLVVLLVAAVLLVRNNDEGGGTLADATSSPTPTIAATASPTTAPSPSPAAVPTPAPTPVATPTPRTTVSVVIVSDYRNPVDVELNDVVRKGVKQGEHISVEVTPRADNNDVISVRDNVHPGCGMGDGQNYFDLDNSYRALVYKTGNNCLEGGTRSGSPGLKIEPV